MKILKIVRLWGGLLAVAFAFNSCGPRAFTKGEYDDPNRVELLDDKFNEADMQQLAEAMVAGLGECPYILNAPKPPSVFVERVQNRTEEHIDMKSLTDKIRTQLIKTRKVRFINKEERDLLDEEYKYNESGYVSGQSQKKKGSQTGADYVLSGALATNIQEVGNDKFIYYKLTLNMTQLETSEIDCTEEKEVRKKFRKRSVGM